MVDFGCSISSNPPFTCSGICPPTRDFQDGDVSSFNFHNRIQNKFTRSSCWIPAGHSPWSLLLGFDQCWQHAIWIDVASIYPFQHECFNRNSAWRVYSMGQRQRCQDHRCWTSKISRTRPRYRRSTQNRGHRNPIIGPSLVRLNIVLGRPRTCQCAHFRPFDSQFSS